MVCPTIALLSSLLVGGVIADRWVSESYALQGIVSSIGGITGPAIGGVWVVGIGPGSVTMIVFATTDALAAAYFVLGPVIAKRQLGGPGAWAALGTAWAIGALIGGTALLQIRPRRPMLVGSLVAIALVFPTLLIAIPAPLIVIAVFQIASGIGAIVANTMWWLVLQQNIPPEALSRVTSYEWFGTLATADRVRAHRTARIHIGTGSALYLCGGLSLLITLSLLAVRDVRNLENRAGADVLPVHN